MKNLSSSALKKIQKIHHTLPFANDSSKDTNVPWEKKNLIIVNLFIEKTMKKI